MWKIFPERGTVRVRWHLVEFYTPCNISAMANARDFKFCTRSAMWSLSLVVSECSLSERGQGHVSNFYVDLENFATASSRYTGDIHNTSVVGLFMTQVLASPVHHGVKKRFYSRSYGYWKPTRRSYKVILFVYDSIYWWFVLRGVGHLRP